MNTQTQIQIRIDSRTKNEAKNVLENLGMDISTAVKMLFKQIVYTGTFPLEIRDVNGFRTNRANELREAITDVKDGKKKFASVDKLVADMLS